MEFNTPKNFKNGKYIMNRFRKKDLTILFVGLAISIVFFYLSIVYIAIFKGNPFILIPSLIPAIIASLLVLIPARTKHNLLETIKIFIEYQKRIKFLKWEGVHHFEREENERD